VQSVCTQNAAGDKTAPKLALNPVWQIEVDRVTSEEWSGMLDCFEDANVYQTWSYGAIRWGGKNLSHLVLKRNGGIVAMAQLRIVRPTKLNFGMAYLRWGPLLHRRGKELEVEVAAYMARALHEEYVGKRRLFLQILPNAFVGTQRGGLFQSAFSSFTQEVSTAANLYRTFVLDLSSPLDQLRKNLDAKWRNKLTQSGKKGLKVSAGTDIGQYRTFCRMYNEMFRRKAFETTLDVEEFGRIQESLPEAQRMRILICEQAGMPVAGIVASAMGNSAIYLLGATSDDGLNAKGAYLLQWTMIQWLKENGYKYYDLGGIDPEGNAGVYSFKKGFSGTDVSHLAPLLACENVVSSTVVRASLVADRMVRRIATLRRGHTSNSK
jgi:lipid II:glycine glycyltransferase (peptidoglycan interpeptide bridge formation enzyme)